jgi:HPt (histidine-containing phosphotransfer) domain-containing protein
VAIRPLDLEGMQRQLGDDEELIMEVIGLFLDDYPRRLKDLEAALAGRSAAEVRVVAHTIKGGASTLCALPTVTAARELEAAAADADFEAIARHAQRVVIEIERLGDALRTLRVQRLREGTTQR